MAWSIGMSLDYGIKITKPFFDVNTASDEDLIFSSSWPSLPIAESANVSSGTTYTHSVGFSPFFSVWQKSGTLWTRIGTQFGDVSVNESTIVFPSATETHIQLYNINLDTAKEYELSDKISQPASYDPDYGLKIVKVGEDINSTDLRDFVLHTHAQSPLIRAQVKAVSSSTGGIATFTETTDTISWVFGFIKNSTGRWTIIPYENQAYPQLLIEQVGGFYKYTAEYNSSFGDTDSCLIVLRDPMFASTDVEVTY